MDTVSERSFYPITVTFLQDGETAAAPATARYKIDCRTTGREITGWTDIAAPASVVTINVTPEQNAIFNQCNRFEKRTMTIEANYDTPTQFVDRHDWNVRNLMGRR